MTDNIKRRLCSLRNEFAAGEQMLQELHTKEVSVQSTLLRISGAIQVLEELITADGAALQQKEQKPPSTERTTPAVAAG